MAQVFIISNLEPEKLGKAVAVGFEKHPVRKLGRRFTAVSTQSSQQVCLSRCPES